MSLPLTVSANGWEADPCDPLVMGVYQPRVGGSKREVAEGAAVAWWAWEGPPTSRIRLDLGINTRAPAGLVIQLEIWSRVSASWQGERVVQAAWSPTQTPWMQFVASFSGLLTPVWEVRLGANFSGISVSPVVTFDRVGGPVSVILGDDVV